MPTASNIRVILKKNFRAQSCDGGLADKKGGLILAISKLLALKIQNFFASYVQDESPYVLETWCTCWVLRRRCDVNNNIFYFMQS